MSKPDEYRANAQECERMAAIPVVQNEKATWLLGVPLVRAAFLSVGPEPATVRSF